MDGYGGARTSYINQMKGYSNSTVAFASLLFDEPKIRYLKIKKFTEGNLEYAPAYYWLGMDCFENSENKDSCMTSAHTFLRLAQDGKVDNYFLNNKILKNMIDETTEKAHK